MRATALGFALVLFAAAGQAWAEELTAQEKTWAKACVEGLAAASQRQRDSAAAALGRLGVDAMPVVLANLGRLKTDEHWKALEAACLAMGTKEVVAWLEATKDWPKASAARLQALLDKFRAAKPTKPAAGAPLPSSPDDVGAKVREILDSFRGQNTYMSGDKRIDQLVALGRPAVACLLAEAKDSDDRFGFRTKAAVDALTELVGPEDLPVLAQMLADGHLAIGPALNRMPPDQAIPALLAPVAKGLLSFELLQGLERFERDPRIAKALLTWLEGRTGEESSTLCGSVAECLARVRASESIPVLVRLMGSPNQMMSRRRIASAVTSLGDKRGVEALLVYFRDPPHDYGGRGDWDQHAAGEDLNRVVGRTVYRGRFGQGEDPTVGNTGNFEEAAREFDAWWAASKDRLRFDGARRAWVVDK
jgi:hypothetical protein